MDTPFPLLTPVKIFRPIMVHCLVPTTLLPTREIMKLIFVLCATLTFGMILLTSQSLNWADDAPERETPNVGRLIYTSLSDGKRDVQMQQRLHFCVFDNGENDQIYVGTRGGMWSKGEFDLSIGKNVVATVQVPHLVYGGVLLPLGDVFDGPPDPNPMGVNEQIAVTRIEGSFK